MTLTERTALVTASRRVGGATAIELARGGADVAIVYRSKRDEAEATADEIRSLGRRALVLQADLVEPDACARIVSETAAQLGRLDIVVNMASVYTPKPFDETTLREWDAVMHVDVRASWLCARAAVPHMRRLGGGRIVNVSDWVARSGRPRYQGFMPYYVAKGAVIALTEAMALELAGDRILVNAIAPGPVVPPEGSTDAEVAAVEKATPLGRWGGGAEIAKAVRFLVESDFVTGETIRVDGGRHLR